VDLVGLFIVRECVSIVVLWNVVEGTALRVLRIAVDGIDPSEFLSVTRFLNFFAEFLVCHNVPGRRSRLKTIVIGRRIFVRAVFRVVVASIVLQLLIRKRIFPRATAGLSLIQDK
jgi:hypothetical protein